MGSISKINENYKRIYAEIVKESSKKKVSESLKEDMQKLEMNKNEEDERTWRKSSVTHNNDIGRPALAKNHPMPRYHSILLGLCYAWNNYVHKTIDCRAYARDRNTWIRNSYENTRYQSEGNCVKNPTATFGSTYNRFGALNYEIEWYRCHNFGHKARNYRSRFTGSSS